MELISGINTDLLVTYITNPNKYQKYNKKVLKNLVDVIRQIISKRCTGGDLNIIETRHKTFRTNNRR